MIYMISSYNKLTNFITISREEMYNVDKQFIQIILVMYFVLHVIAKE